VRALRGRAETPYDYSLEHFLNVSCSNRFFECYKHKYFQISTNLLVVVVVVLGLTLLLLLQIPVNGALFNFYEVLIEQEFTNIIFEIKLRFLEDTKDMSVHGGAIQSRMEPGVRVTVQQKTFETDALVKVRVGLSHVTASLNTIYEIVTTFCIIQIQLLKVFS